jgi:hypothetical protein
VRGLYQDPGARGLALVRGHYDDGGYSGGSMVGPALQKLLVDVQATRIDVIVVYKLDRLTRSLADFAKRRDVRQARRLLRVGDLVLQHHHQHGTIDSQRVAVAAFPPLQLSLLRIRTFCAAAGGSFFTRLGIGGVPFLLPLLYLVGLGFTPVPPGLLIIP